MADNGKRPWERAGVSYDDWLRALEYVRSKHVEAVEDYLAFLRSATPGSVLEAEAGKVWATRGLRGFWAVADGDRDAVQSALAEMKQKPAKNQ